MVSPIRPARRVSSGRWRILRWGPARTASETCSGCNCPERSRPSSRSRAERRMPTRPPGPPGPRGRGLSAKRSERGRSKRARRSERPLGTEGRDGRAWAWKPPAGSTNSERSGSRRWVLPRSKWRAGSRGIHPPGRRSWDNSAGRPGRIPRKGSTGLTDTESSSVTAGPKGPRQAQVRPSSP